MGKYKVEGFEKQLSLSPSLFSFFFFFSSSHLTCYISFNIPASFPIHLHPSPPPDQPLPFSGVNNKCVFSTAHKYISTSLLNI